MTGWAAITGSELAVARLVAEGLTNREVAEWLFLSPHTVNSHLRHVFHQARHQLARRAGAACEQPRREVTDSDGSTVRWQAESVGRRCMDADD
jgi:DNA-binding CsgD family transcriptional regulator